MSTVATGGFLQRLVDEGSMPLAEAVRRTTVASAPTTAPVPAQDTDEAAAGAAPHRPPAMGEQAAAHPAPPEAPAVDGAAPAATGTPGPEPPARGPAGATPAPPSAPLRDAGIRSVTRLGGVAGHGPPDDHPLAAPGMHQATTEPAAASPSPPPRLDEGAPGELEDRWRDLGRRLLAAHPPAGPARPGRPPPASAAEPVTRAPARPRAAPAGAGAADQPPELLIEHLEVRLVAPAPTGEPGPPARPEVPADPHGPWDAAVRHYLGRL